MGNYPSRQKDLFAPSHGIAPLPMGVRTCVQPRLVVAELERRWNEALRTVQGLE